MRVLRGAYSTPDLETPRLSNHAFSKQRYSRTCQYNTPTGKARKRNTGLSSLALSGPDTKASSITSIENARTRSLLSGRSTPSYDYGHLPQPSHDQRNDAAIQFFNNLLEPFDQRIGMVFNVNIQHPSHGSLMHKTANTP